MPDTLLKKPPLSRWLSFYSGCGLIIFNRYLLHEPLGCLYDSFNFFSGLVSIVLFTALLALKARSISYDDKAVLIVYNMGGVDSV